MGEPDVMVQLPATRVLEVAQGLLRAAIYLGWSSRPTVELHATLARVRTGEGVPEWSEATWQELVERLVRENPPGAPADQIVVRELIVLAAEVARDALVVLGHRAPRSLADEFMVALVVIRELQDPSGPVMTARERCPSPNGSAGGSCDA
jgi:hypothetical protein